VAVTVKVPVVMLFAVIVLLPLVAVTTSADVVPVSTKVLFPEPKVAVVPAPVSITVKLILALSVDALTVTNAAAPVVAVYAILPSNVSEVAAVMMFAVDPIVKVPVPVFEIVSLVAAASTNVLIDTFPDELSKIVIAPGKLSVNEVIDVTPVPVKFRVEAELSVQAVNVTPPVLLLVLLIVNKEAVSAVVVSLLIVNAFVPATLIVLSVASSILAIVGAVALVLLLVKVSVVAFVVMLVAMLSLPVPANVNDVKELSVKVSMLLAPVPVEVLVNVIEELIGDKLVITVPAVPEKFKLAIFESVSVEIVS